MNSWQYIAPFAFWIFLAVIIVTAGLFGYLKSRSRDRAISDIVQRGQPVPPEMFELTPQTSRVGLLIGGLVMLVIGIALWRVGLSIVHAHQSPAGSELVGLFPGGIGLALLISYFMSGRGRDEAR
jgi:hypothetical protein